MISFRPALLLSVSCFLLLGTNRNVVQSFSLTSSSFPTSASTSKSTQTQLYAHTSNTNDNDKQTDRRSLFQETAKLLSAGFVSSSLISTSPQPANAMNNKSRSENYTVQYTDREWSYMLSGKQYNILRQGGTERPNTSILEGEEREGEYRCAGCATPLFASSAKFHSGTGWPSYASALAGVEVEAVNPVQANLLGAEIRCGTCGGHLGDVFNDGFVYVGTPAFATGKRFCVDGGALIFKPSDGTEDVFGDLTPPKKEASVPSFLQPPKIVPNNA